MRPDVATWLKWAAEHEIHEHIMAFIQTYGEEVLFCASDTYSFPTPRSWEMASKVMRQADKEDLKRAVAACVGLPMADRFYRYLEIYRKVNAKNIIAGKEKPDFRKKSEPSYIYAVIFAVAGYLSTVKVTDKDLGNIVSFIESPGIGPEYQILFFRQLYNRAVELFDRLKALPEFRELAGKIVNLRASLY